MFPPLNSTVQTAAQHTPGPWEADAHLIVRDAHGRIVARCCATLGKYELEEPNARMIAAAPELLEALKTLLSASVGEFNDEDMGVAIDMAHAAIAKAEGSSNA